MPDIESISNPFCLLDLPDESWEPALSKLFRRLLVSYDFSAFSEISVSFVEPATMRELNRDYRDRDEPTDILTFHVPAGPAMPQLGDIYLCVDAMPLGFGLKNTLDMVLFMVAHGALHLLGFTHETEEKLQAMIELQTELIASIQVS